MLSDGSSCNPFLESLEFVIVVVVVFIVVIVVVVNQKKLQSPFWKFIGKDIG
jgi:hypothetical protein